jgi:predicted metal-dependent hydrolase
VDLTTFQRGVALFDNAEFFAAHEVLEDVWRDAAGPEKKYLQGLIQIAVAFHHHGTGNSAGARSLLARAIHNLADCPEVSLGIQLSPLRHSLAQWQEVLNNSNPVTPPLPRLELSKDNSRSD